MILLDTNVLSEALRPEPSRQVVAWLDRRQSEYAISSISVLELMAGVVLLPASRRRSVLDAAARGLVQRFGPRVFPFDAASAIASAELLDLARRQGSGLHQMPAKLADLQIAGIAIAHGLSLATRNLSDFEGLGLNLIDPWSS